MKLYIGETLEKSKLLMRSKSENEVNTFINEYVEKNYPKLGDYFRFHYTTSPKLKKTLDFGSHYTFFFIVYEENDRMDYDPRKKDSAE